MRIVGGQFRRRSLVTPQTNSIRPTSDRLREALFNILEHSYDDAVNGANVLDLFSGTGALGLEALSRGAAYATFIDKGSEARAIIHANIKTLGVGNISNVLRLDATVLGANTQKNPFSVIFCDPPYGQNLAQKALTSGATAGWFAPNALIIVEEEINDNAILPENHGFTFLEERRYGETRFIFAQYVLSEDHK